MLNLFKSKKTKNENVKPKLSIAKQITNLSSFDNIKSTVKTCLDNRQNTYKSFIDNLPYEIALGSYLNSLDNEASNQKNRNKWKHNELAKNGFGTHTTNDKNQSKFEYTVFTKQELNVRKQAFKHSTMFYNYCSKNDYTSFVYAWQNFRKDNIELFATKDNSKQASHNRKTNKQSKTNKKEASKITASFDSQKMLDKIVTNKGYKELSNEALAKQCLVLVQVMYAENGMDFEKLMKNDKTKNTVLKALKVA
tara:strand:+ start:213 stop:965 length:753 start_codon:yes stop_codon:yes gene_type:complete